LPLRGTFYAAESHLSQNGTGNHLLNGLKAEEFALIQPHLEEISIKRGVVLAEAGQAAPHVFFPVTAILSLVGSTESGATVEVALVGREGVAGVSAALGRQRLPFRVVVQLEGIVWKISTDVISDQLHQCRDLHERLLVHSHRMIAQVGQSAICNRFHTARQRLARWLLMTSDRVDSRELPLTHEFIAHMVGGPRSAVTEAAAALRESGAIDYRRGQLTICSVSKLRQQSCECYDFVRDAQPE
jgi:CRP-like cAMP-binding protein